MGVIIGVCGQKGGVGKSMIARNAAVKASSTHKVLVVDADEQKTAGKFIGRRQEKHPNLAKIDYLSLNNYEDMPKLRELAKQFDFIFVDIGGKADNHFMMSLICSDIAIMPFDPSQDSIDTVPLLESKLIQARKKVNPSLIALSVISKGFSSGNLNEITANALKEVDGLIHLDTPIINRAAYIYGISEGLAIFEYKPLQRKAKRDFNNFYKVMMKEVAKHPSA